MRDLIVDYLRLMRIPGIVGLAITPVVGALSVNVLTPHLLIYLFLIGIISKIYGFVMNDYFDVEIDKLSSDLSKRALVKGSISKKTALYIIILCSFLGYLAVFVFFYRNNQLFYTGLLCMIIADILGIVYNAYGKKLIGSDFLIALSECMFFLFGTFMVLSEGTPGIVTWLIFIILFNEQLYMNVIAGALKDVDHDYILGVKNVALASGVTVKKDKSIIIPLGFKLFGIGEQIFSSVFIFTPFIFFNVSYSLWQIPILIIFVIILLVSCFKMLNIKRYDRYKINKLIAAQLIAFHFFVPIMLISIIGVLYCVLLIVLPFLWYGLISKLIGQKVLESQM